MGISEMPGPGNDLARIMTCGSVDDGKSTLIGRLLHDAGEIHEDHMRTLAADSRRHGTVEADLDFALLLDGLESEREQGITIDVAYRHLSTPQRSFIIADAPGHEQYIRNMVTAASRADLAVVLVDASAGILTQARRHATICALMGVRRLALVVNKMDLVDFRQEVFEVIAAEFRDFTMSLGVAEVVATPVCARDGDNLARRSARMPWFTGPSVLEYLETVDLASEAVAKPFRLSVQMARRLQGAARGYSGLVLSGCVRVGDEVTILPGGRSARVARLSGLDGEREYIYAGEAATLVLDAPVDAARGDMIAAARARPVVSNQFAAQLIWLGEDPMLAGRSYLMRIGDRWVTADVTALKHRLDIDSQKRLAAQALTMNEIGGVNIATAGQIVFDPYDHDRATGSFILVDRFTQQTVAAGLVAHALRRADNIHPEAPVVTKAARALRHGQNPVCFWFTGLSGSGKSTITKLLEARLHDAGFHTMLLDGDNLRHGVNRDLGFTDADRVENIRRAGEIARLMTDAGLVVLCAFISPFRADREMVGDLFEPGTFFEIHVDTPIETCIRRDAKGLYAKALNGEIPNFTGVSGPYEAPLSPALRISGDGFANETVEQSFEWFSNLVSAPRHGP